MNTMISEEGAGADSSAPALRLTGVTKRFGSLTANDAINIDFAVGSIHAVLGENGAGKSTLMNIVVGSIAPDAGQMAVNGIPMPWPTPREAIQRGIGIVHQHFMLVPTLTVAENLLLSVLWMPEGKHNSLQDASAAVDRLGEQHDLRLDAEAVIDDLSVGEKVRLEIIKVLWQGELSGGLRLFVLDEPTALLTRQEIEILFSILRGFAERGTAVVIITHKLDEVMEISDRVTVLRDGRVANSLETAAASLETLATLMVGRDLPARRHTRGNVGDAVLTVSDLNLTESDHHILDNVSLEVRSGEIVGIAGVAGNGQDILAECLTGLRKSSSGTVLLFGRDITQAPRHTLIEREVAHVPEDRRVNAVVGSLSIKHNAVLGLHWWSDFQIFGWSRNRAISAHGQTVRTRLGVRSTSADQPVDALSGGNQQRVILGRELHKEASLLVASGPSRGLDVGGTEYVQNLLVEQRDRGAAVLLISLDLDELLALSDRLLVMYEGRIIGEMNPETADVATLGLMMGGSATTDVANKRDLA